LPYHGQAVEGLFSLDKNRLVAWRGLGSAHDHVDVERVQLDPAKHAVGLLGGDEGRTGAEKRIDDNIAAIGEVEERVLELGGRLDGRMVLEVLLAAVDRQVTGDRRERESSIAV
jgi:hypothetical protein